MGALARSKVYSQLRALRGNAHFCIVSQTTDKVTWQLLFWMVKINSQNIQATLTISKCGLLTLHGSSCVWQIIALLSSQELHDLELACHMPTYPRGGPRHVQKSVYIVQLYIHQPPFKILLHHTDNYVIFLYSFRFLYYA